MKNTFEKNTNYTRKKKRVSGINITFQSDYF